MTVVLSSTRNYFARSLRADLVAGLTVAMVVLPQSMAYAAIANVNPIYGIYTAIAAAVVGALAGSSRVLVTGPTNATALVTLSVLGMAVERADYVEMVFALALVAGLIKLVLGLLRLGNIIRFISNSVLTGFLAAAAILITVDQFGNLFGIRIPKDQGMLAILVETVRKAGEINPFVVITAMVGIAVMLLTRRVSRKLPAALLAIVIVGLMVQLAGWHLQGVKLVSDLGLPTNPGLNFHLPQASLTDLIDLLPAAGAVALFSLVEAMSISKALGKASGQRPDASREFIGQGLASIACGLLQGIPPSGSPSRSAVNYNAGAKTRLAAAFSGGFVWLSLVIFIGLIGYIPVPGLAAVVVVSALGLVDRKHTWLTWRARPISRLVMATTFAATLLLPLHIAIYLGVVLSILIHLYESGHLNLTYLVFEENGQVREKQLEDLYALKPQVAVLNVEGDLFFGAVTDLERAVDGCLQAGVKVLVLRLRRIRSLASTGVTTLQWIIVTARRQGTAILLSGVSPEARTMLDTVGITSLVGAENIFGGGEVVFESTRRALDAARQCLSKE